MTCWCGSNQYATGNAVDALFLLEYVLIGAAALHPSMAEAVTPTPQQKANIYVRENDGRRRIPVVAFAGFVPPSLLLVASLPRRLRQRAGACPASASPSSPSSTCG